MKRLKVLIISLFILSLAGCSDYYMICSLNPFYLDKDVTMVTAIVGKWKAIPLQQITASGKKGDSPPWQQFDTTSCWKIERVISKETVKTKKGKDSVFYKPLNYYMVNLISTQKDTTFYKFRMVLFRINKALYADLMPVDNTGLSKSLLASESYFSVHTLARVVLRNNQFSFSWLGAEYMKEMIEKKRVRVSYMWVHSASRLLLTGTPEQLTGMIERYANEPRFIDWNNQKAMLKLNRIK
jgi:hypothetical protein